MLEPIEMRELSRLAGRREEIMVEDTAAIG
jgi:hypothetical protein